MPQKLGFLKAEISRGMEAIPDSDMNVLRSTSSVVSSSSASASANRSSFASDFMDRDSSASDNYQHLAGHGSGGKSLSGVDPDPDKHFTVHKRGGFTGTRDHEDKAVQKQDSQFDVEEDLSSDSTLVSFSSALKDCKDRRSKTKVHRKKWDFTHPISVEVKSSSPRLDTLMKTSHPTRPSSTMHSPDSDTPTYQHQSVGMLKGWNSERMPLPHKGNRVGPALLPLTNVKILPSKWEDAERWIFSPASGGSSHRQPVQQHQLQRKPKAKSGPLGPPGSTHFSMYTPVIPMSERRSVGDLMAGSPFSAILMETNGLLTQDDLGKGSPARLEPWMPRSISLHGCSVDLPGHSSLPISRDEEIDNNNYTAKNISCPVSRRDIRSQISLADSINSSFKKISSPCNEERVETPYLEIREAEVDKKLTIGSLRSIHRANQSGRSSRRVDDIMKKTMVSQLSTWACTETALLGRSEIDESRITAWENLQKAKAEAAIQKLEMKLEKKKKSSMDKILKKLKSAQQKAQEMRKSIQASQVDHLAKPSSYKSSSMKKMRRKSSMSGCFTCHAFDLPKCMGTK